MKQMVALLCCFVIATGLTMLSPYIAPRQISEAVTQTFDVEHAMIPQKVLETTKDEQIHYVIYEKDQIIGILHDKHKLDAMLTRVYETKYRDEFPDTQLGLGEDIHLSSEVSYFTYEDQDEAILQYLEEHNLFSVETNKIEFSNKQVIYVKNMDDFHAAKDQFALNFIDETSYDRLRNGKEIPELSDEEYGSRIERAGFKEDMKVSRSLAPIDVIAKTQDDVLKLLSYGYTQEPQFYETKEYDTVQGIAWIHDISIPHLLSLNQDILVGEQQLLDEGTKLNVTPLNSPIHFEVIQENQVEETVYPSEPLIIYDDTLQEGMEFIETKQQLGTENARYQETFINGKSTGNGRKVSSVITKQPVREVKRVGTKIYPHIGSGHFRWPVEVVSITCPWLCYSGHMATDVQNRYNFYGQVLASDRGVVIDNSYDPIGGYHMTIDHNNGYTTYYGHMVAPGYYPAGTIVEQGEAIGDIGMTGMATGPHVHFEIRYQGERINPETLVGK